MSSPEPNGWWIRAAAAAALAVAFVLVACSDDSPGGQAADGGGSEAQVYQVDALSRRPELSNREEINSVMERLYPRPLQDDGIGGTVVTEFVIRPDGSVEAGTAKVLESTHEGLSEPSLKVVESLRFEPGQHDGENVRVLVQMPITWQPAG